MKSICLATLAASTLVLTACTAAEEDPMAESEDSAMMAPDGDDPAMTNGESAGVPPASAESAMPGRTTAGNGDDRAGDRCGAGEVAKYVGREATPDVRAQIAEDVGHSRIRWVGPDTVVTMDFSPERLNVRLDADGIITGADCA